MSYNYSPIDAKNLKWFEHNDAQATLLAAELRKGALRGLKNAHLRFRYPITAIAGQNGTGKTTALALAACAFHNTPSGHNPLGRKNTYYTFSDFFVQSAEEAAPKGIDIWYEILHNGWTPSKECPETKGPAWQRRSKVQGKWSNYAGRVNRNVVFYGIERIVPHAERSVYRSYKSRFRDAPPHNWDATVCDALSRVLGKKYEKLWFKKYGEYLLPMLRLGGKTMSGFNLGAGENALISMLSGIHSCTGSLLIVADEIELGLHEEAQIRLIREFKEIAAKRFLQVICTTHSSAILASLPPEGRLFIDAFGGKNPVIEGVSVDFAAGRLSGVAKAVVDVLVEDEVARAVVNHALPGDMRSRVRILPMGSAGAIIRYLAARRKDTGAIETIVFLDGDQTQQWGTHFDNFKKALETPKSDVAENAWLQERLHFLPGDKWPEQWVVATLLSGDLASICGEFRTEEHTLRGVLEQSLTKPRHSEYFHIATALSFDVSYLRERLAGLAHGMTSTSTSLTEAVRCALARATT